MCLGIDIQEIRIKRKHIYPYLPFTFRVWDFAGQEDYYVAHQCFLSERSLYLLIWDLTEGESGISGLKPWLGNLATRVPGSTVIIIGTKLDLVESNKQIACEEWVQEKIHELITSEMQFRKIDIRSIISFTSVTTYKDYRKSMFYFYMNIITVTLQI